jgi:hypothetical protein
MRSSSTCGRSSDETGRTGAMLSAAAPRREASRRSTVWAAGRRPRREVSLPRVGWRIVAGLRELFGSRAGVAAIALLVAACSSAPAADSAGCHVEVTRNTTDEADVAACATLGAGDAGGFVLSIDASTAAIARMTATVDLGAAPVAGRITSDDTTDWSFVALAGASSCSFQAGGASVPAGSFTLTLDSIDTAAATVHGTLDVVAYVHAPPATDCGYDDLEDISIRF